MPIRIPIGRRTFSPPAGFTLLTILLCVGFFFLGRWQWHRWELRQAEWDRFAAGTERVIPLGSKALGDVPRFQRVSLVGRLDPQHQFLLDNRSHAGMPGYEVLTALRRPNGATALVDRGWLAFRGRRDRLPQIGFESDTAVTVTGRTADLPSAGLASGRAPPGAGAPWPKVTTFPSMAQLSAAYGATLERRIVLLDAQDPHGYVRDWHPPGLEPLRNLAYAVQWWAFAAVLLVIWVVMGLRAGAGGATRAPGRQA